jgi:tetratricopeptide (TPR) repeat protein
MAFALQTVDAYLAQASSLVGDHKYKEALALLRKALQTNPDSQQVLIQLGSLLVKIGEAEEGDRHLARALDLSPGNPAVLLRQAEAKLLLGRTEDAEKLLSKTLWYKPSNADAHHRLAYTYLVQGREGEALQESRESVELDPLSPRFRSFYSLLLSLNQQDLESLQQLRVASKLDPNSPVFLYRLAQKERMRGNLGQALEYSELAAQLDPENPLYIHEQARLWKLIGSPEAAEEVSARAKEMDQAFQVYRNSLSLSQTGEPVAAISALEELFGSDIHFPSARLLLARLYQGQGSSQKAMEQYLIAFAENPRLSRAVEEAAWIKVDDGAVQEALGLMDQAGLSSPNSTLLRGYQRLLDDDWEGALEAFREVRTEYPLNTHLLQLVAQCLGQLGRYQEAHEVLRTALQTQPDKDEIRSQINDLYFDLALQSIERSDWDSAVPILTTLTKAQPEKADYHFYLGYAHQLSGDFQTAARAYRKGLAGSPDSTWARINLAACLYRSGSFHESALQWERISSQVGSQESYFQLGLCYSQLGRDIEAEVALEKSLKMGNDSPEAIYNLGIIRLRLFKTKDAWSLVRIAALKGYAPAIDLMRRAN